MATNATILDPCEAGEHAVVAAGSVVTRDVPPYHIVAGNPARNQTLLKSCGRPSGR